MCRLSQALPDETIHCPFWEAGNVHKLFQRETTALFFPGKVHHLQVRFFLSSLVSCVSWLCCDMCCAVGIRWTQQRRRKYDLGASGAVKEQNGPFGLPDTLNASDSGAITKDAPHRQLMPRSQAIDVQLRANACKVTLLNTDLLKCMTFKAASQADHLPTCQKDVERSLLVSQINMVQGCYIAQERSVTQRHVMCVILCIPNAVCTTLLGHRTHMEKALSLPGRRKLQPRRS